MITIEQQIAILQAYKEGKTIQTWNYCLRNWHDIPPLGDEQGGSPECQFNFYNEEYRIKPGQEGEIQQDPVKTRETGYEFLKEQITKALEPMLRPEELQREIKAYMEDRFEYACGESLYDAAYKLMEGKLLGTQDEDPSPAFKNYFLQGVKDYLKDSSSAIDKLIKDNPEINGVLKDIATSSGNDYIRSAAADAVEKYINESDHGYDKIWDWVQYQINEDEDLKDNLRSRIEEIAKDQIENHLEINVQLD